MKSVLFGCLVALVAAAGGGCKSGPGERCQVNNDCKDGYTPPLVCNLAQGICSNGTGIGQDANIPIDAPTDAKVDAHPDAPPDSH